MGIHKVYIDGAAGTAGLQLQKRLEARPDIRLLQVAPELRKDEAARRELMNSAEVVFLCLPDEAAAQAVELVEDPDTVVIDCSTAHRTAPGWVYGFPELSAGHREAVAGSGRIANPGCHATGFISLVYPLTALGLLPDDSLLCCHSITGYSGGGKKMIAEYEDPGRPAAFGAPRQYALGQTHKHLSEMQKITGLVHKPVFCPMVCDFYSGMAVTLPLHGSQLRDKASPGALAMALEEFYSGSGLITVSAAPQGMIDANELSGSNRLRIYVGGNDERLTLTAVFDNLGKGAAGAAVQNMNIALGLDETAYLDDIE